MKIVLMIMVEAQGHSEVMELPPKSGQSFCTRKRKSIQILMMLGMKLRMRLTDLVAVTKEFALIQ